MDFRIHRATRKDLHQGLAVIVNGLIGIIQGHSQGPSTSAQVVEHDRLGQASGRNLGREAFPDRFDADGVESGAQGGDLGGGQPEGNLAALLGRKTGWIRRFHAILTTAQSKVQPQQQG